MQLWQNSYLIDKNLVQRREDFDSQIQNTQPQNLY